MIISIGMAAFLDRLESRYRRWREQFDVCPPWLAELQAYREDPRLTKEEVWYRYSKARDCAAPFFTKGPLTLDVANDFFVSEYPLWRQVIHRRHTTWRRVLWTMRGRTGVLAELGCGIAPVSAWLAPRRPRWYYAIDDLGGVALDYARARLRSFRTCAWKSPLCEESLDIVVCLDVLEHLPDPAAFTHEILRRLPRGGIVHWNLIHGDVEGTNLAPQARRVEARALFQTITHTIWDSPDHTVGVKR